MKIICTICGRKGSKGLKNKNLLKINNISLFNHTLNKALKIKKIDNIVVSTDIKKLIKKNTKKIYFLKRPSYLSGDNVNKIDVIRHAVKVAEENFNKTFDFIIDLDISSPLRNLFDIENSIKIFLKKKPNNLFSVCSARKNPYFNMVEQKNNKIRILKRSKKKIIRRQDAPKVFEMNASIYIWKKNYLFSTKNLFSNNTIIYEMPYERSIDIDNVNDFKIVKFLMKNEKR